MLDHPRAQALRQAIESLGQGGPGTPVAALTDLAIAFHGQGLTLDLASARRIGVPVVVLRECRAAPIEGLTCRERQVVDAVAGGLSNREIASQLGISIATVKDHVHHILRKAGVPSRARLAAIARQGSLSSVRLDRNPSKDGVERSPYNRAWRL